MRISLFGETKVGRIIKKNNTLSGVFFGGIWKVFCRHLVPIFRKKARRRFMGMKGGIVFASQK
jgi:hypothetical protein